MSNRASSARNNRSEIPARQVARSRLVLPVRVRCSSSCEDALALYLSPSGCLIETMHKFEINDTITVELPDNEKAGHDATIVGVGAGVIDCHFNTELSARNIGDSWLRGAVRDTAIALDYGSLEPLARAIGLARKRSGLSATELAHRIGVSRPTLWSWETGKTRPSQANLEKLREALSGSRHGERKDLAEDVPAPKLETVIKNYRNRLAKEIGIDENCINIRIDIC